MQTALARVGTDDEPLPGKTSFYYLSNLILALLCAITLAVMTVLTVKVTKLVWHQDRVVPFMLFFLNLSLFGM